ncbi:hypothetical protein WJX73_010489 [Symbiochloris irregularis]|uniref:Uncharacterized protein n=1 Tax=Symbiochloris irregularis TaxID=706552 RepID=A0AAW1NPC8_9CHLO
MIAVTSTNFRAWSPCRHGTMAFWNGWLCLALAVLPIALAQSQTSSQSTSINGTGGFSLDNVLLCSVQPTEETFQSATQPEIWYIVATNFYGNNEYDIFALNVTSCAIIVLPVGQLAASDRGKLKRCAALTKKQI